MKKQVLFSLILAAALLLVPVGALAADATPTGSGNALSSNGAEDFTITTKAAMNALISASHATTLPGFTEGTSTDGTATVAYWKGAGGSYYFVYLSNATELTLNAGKTANLSGNVSIGSLTIDKDAALAIREDADTLNASGDVAVSGTLTVYPGANFAAGAVTVSGTLTNNGAVTASDLGTGTSGGVISNGENASITAAGNISISSDGSLTNHGSLSAGSLTNKGNVKLYTTISITKADGAITTSGDGGYLESTERLTIGEKQTLSISDGGTVKAGIDNNGTVTLEGSKSRVSGGDLTNAGTLTVSGGEVDGKVLNNSSGKVTVTGGTLNSVTNSGTLDVSAGEIKNTVENALGGGTLNLSGTGALNGGVNNKAGATLNMDGGTIKGELNNSGTADISGGKLDGNVTNEATMTLAGAAVSGVLDNDGSLTLGDGVTLADDVYNREHGVIDGTTLSIAEGKCMTNEHQVSVDTLTVAAKGSLVNTKGASITEDSSLVNNGTVTNDGSIASSSLTNTGKLTNQSKGKISSATVTNSGNLTNDKGANITSAATVTNTGTLTNSGTITAKVTNEKSGTLTNKSVITGAVTNNGGTVTNTESGSMSGAITNGEGGTVNNGGSISGDVDNKGTIKNTTDTASVSGKVTGKEVESTAAAKPITATNSEKTVTLSEMPAGSVLTTAKLEESSDGYKALKSAAKDAKVICAYDITCNKTFTGTKTLTFILGKDHAGKAITALHYINGIVDTYKGKADSSGNFSMPITSLSPFMLVEGAVSGSGSGSKPVKTGDAADSLPGLALILLAAGVYIWRKRTA